MVRSEPPVTESEKRASLDAVLSSASFARSAQLRTLLRHICECEMAGRPGDLTEHQIAVDVLGRRGDDLSEDSSVRNRAYELRQRLERYYSSEQPEAAIRIEIPRGGYVPVYSRQATRVQPAPGATNGALPQPARRFPWRLAVLPALVVAAVSAGYLLRQTPQPSLVLKEAWGPLADPGGEMLLVIATNMHMTVRPHIAPHPQRLPAPELAYSAYGRHRPLPSGAPLFMEPAQLSVPLGELSAAVTLCNLRAAFGGTSQILPEAEAPVAALRGRNGVLLGSGTNSESASALLRNLPYTINYTNTDEFAVFDQRQPAGKNQLFVSQPNGDPVPSVLYGLLTVINSTDLGGKPKRTVVVSGSGSAGVQAGVEFFCSPERMQEMKDRFGKAGIKGFPAIYQVVVRCKTSGIRLLSYEYAGHAVADSF